MVIINDQKNIGEISSQLFKKGAFGALFKLTQ